MKTMKFMNFNGISRNFMNFMIFAVLSSLGGPGRPCSGICTPPQLLTPICIIRVCARAQPGMLCSHLWGRGGILHPPLSQTLSKGEQHPNKLKFVGMLKMGKAVSIGGPALGPGLGWAWP